MKALLYVMAEIICSGCALERVYAAVRLVDKLMKEAEE